MTPEQLAVLDGIQRGQRHLLGLINGVLSYAEKPCENAGSGDPGR